MARARPSASNAVGGAVPLDSEFYVARPADGEMRSSLLKRDSIVLIKGARQMGKTSLLARGLQFSSPETSFYEVAERAGGAWLRLATILATVLASRYGCPALQATAVPAPPSHATASCLPSWPGCIRATRLPT